MDRSVQSVITPTLTEPRITEAMTRARSVACSSFDDRCFALPDTPHEAQGTCTPKGRCKIGWIVAASRRTSWDVWLDVHTGEGCLRKRPAWQ